MPCVHIAISCFNPRLYRVPCISTEDQCLQNPVETSHQLPQPEPTTYEEIDSDTLHITNAWLDAFYNDHHCMELRGIGQTTEIMCVKMYAAGIPKKHIIRMFQNFKKAT